jgi:hypothetical protein
VSECCSIRCYGLCTPKHMTQRYRCTQHACGSIRVRRASSSAAAWKHQQHEIPHRRLVPDCTNCTSTMWNLTCNISIIYRYPTFCFLAGVDSNDDSPRPPKPIDPALGPGHDIYGNDTWPGLDGVNIWPFLMQPDEANWTAAHPTLVLSHEVILVGDFKLLTAVSLCRACAAASLSRCHSPHRDDYDEHRREATRTKASSRLRTAGRTHPGRGPTTSKVAMAGGRSRVSGVRQPRPAGR